MVKIFKKYLYIILLALILAACKSEYEFQEPKLNIEIDSTVLKIGDIITYRLFPIGTNDQIIVYPQIPGTESMEIRNQDLLKRGNQIIGKEFSIVFWDTGSFHIPTLEIEVLRSDSTFDYAFISDSISVSIVSSILDTDDRIIKPIKDPFPLKFPLRWKMIIRIVVLIALFGILVYLFTQRQKSDKIIEKPIERFPSASEIALQQLEELIALMKKSDKEFYVQLTHLIREFLENKWYFSALEMTTADLELHHSLVPFCNSEFTYLISMLQKADLVKFAKNLVDSAERKEDVEWVRNFINAHS